jgi:hypothetical protein
MLNDTDGLFDPANPGSPYFGLIDGKQILLQCWNPVAAVWVPQYRGVIDDYSYDFSGAVNAAGEPLIATIALECVDAFDYLAGVEMIPGLFGDPVPPDRLGRGCVLRGHRLPDPPTAACYRRGMAAAGHSSSPATSTFRRTSATPATAS